MPAEDEDLTQEIAPQTAELDVPVRRRQPATAALEDAVVPRDERAATSLIVSVPDGKGIRVGLDGIALGGDKSEVGGPEATVAITGVRGTASVGHHAIAIGGRAATVVGGVHATSVSSGPMGTAIAGDYGVAVTGPNGLAKSGQHGRSVSGHRGCSETGDGGLAVTGHGGTAKAGHGGTAIAGIGGDARAGLGGYAAAGEGGQIWLRRSMAQEKEGWRKALVGEDIHEDVIYRLDEHDEFVPVATSHEGGGA